MRKFLKGSMVICSLLLPSNAVAQDAKAEGEVVQEQVAVDSVSPQGTKVTLMKRLGQVQQFLDNKAKKKVDPQFIEVPEKPWRVILRYKANEVDVDFDNTTYFDESEHSDWHLGFDPPTATSIGFWVGYCGTGVGFSKSLTKNVGRYFSISSTGARYGFNFRLRRFSTSAATLDATDYKDGNAYSEEHYEGYMPAEVWIRSVYVNGYYVFNGRRYSQAAAYNQSVIQRRSAGSFLAGATWYQSSLDYSELDNSLFILLSHNVGRIKVHQANLGLGYGYNWVPFRGLVANAMVMPTVSVYNRVKTYEYDFNYCLPTPRAQEDDFGEWNPETRTWANGKTHKPLRITEEDLESDTRIEDFDRWEAGTETTYSWLRFNLDLRLGVAYNWKNYFIGLQAQYNNFSYRKDENKVNLFDAYARLSLGVRL